MPGQLAGLQPDADGLFADADALGHLAWTESQALAHRRTSWILSQSRGLNQ